MGTWFQFSEYLWILCSVAAGRGGVSWGSMGDTGLTVGSEGLASQTLNLSVLRSPGRPQTLPAPAEVPSPKGGARALEKSFPTGGFCPLGPNLVPVD